MIKIIVCIKQVPSSTAVEVDPITGVLKRDSSAVKMNPYDLYALETAFKIKQQCNAQITALTMGPMQAQAVLHEAIYMGADKGILLTDRRFAGADVFATSYAIAGCIKAVGIADLIICGKQTTDGDTGQVGAEVAELLECSYTSNITKVTKADASGLCVVSSLDTADLELKISYPWVISVEKGIYTPRLPSLKTKFQIGSIKDRVSIVTLNDLADRDENNYGLKGSPTQVEKIYPPQIVKQQEIFTNSEDQLSQILYKTLKDKKFL